MNIGLPGCFVDVYPYEGGRFALSSFNGALLSCQIEKHIRSFESGSFTLTLAPGGPYGPNASPQWTDILRPMSLVVIGMQRAGRAHIVMIGLVRAVSETTAWQPGGRVSRAISVQGADFSYIFTQQNFYGQLLTFTQGALLGQSGSLSEVMHLGMNNVPIQTAAKAWYSNVMAGTGGLLSHMNFAYQGSRVTFDDLMATLFANYPDTKIQIPVAQNFAIMSGTWADIFAALYPFPWFECFVATAEAGAYGQPAAAAPVNMTTPGFAPASPCLITRFTPLPYLHGPDSPAIDMSYWDKLPTYTLDTPRPVNETIGYSDSDVKNLYAINPRYLGTLMGYSNNSNAHWLYQFGCWLDSASVERYGYRPFVANVDWFADPTGTAAQNNNDIPAFEETVGDLVLKAASYFEPSPLMATGTVMTNLRPDIIPGTKLEFLYEKEQEPWLFYIEGVNHSFTFGRQAVTTLFITRGLPETVYNDQDLLTAIHTGNAMRQDGGYKTGLPAGAGKPLTALNFKTGPDLVSAISAVYSAPGQK